MGEDEQSNKCGWKIYAPGTDGDVPLLKWYIEICRDNSIDAAFAPSMHPLGSFMRNMLVPETGLIYAEDEQGWWGVSWFVPVMGALGWGLWIREDYRGSGRYEKVTFVMETLNVAFQATPIILAPTRQPKVATLSLRFGFTNMGQIPYLFEGQSCYILYQTREGFAPIFERWLNEQSR